MKRLCVVSANLRLNHYSMCFLVVVHLSKFGMNAFNDWDLLQFCTMI